MSELYTKTLTEVAELLQSGEVKAAEAVKSCLDRIDATEPQVKALITVMGDKAMEEALEDSMDDILVRLAEERLSDSQAKYLEHDDFWETMGI